MAVFHKANATTAHVAQETSTLQREHEAAPLRVAIVIPCYNAGKWIQRTVESVLKQSHRPLTVIVIDDGSSDDTLQRLSSFGTDIRVESGPNQGASHARNKGFAMAIEADATHVIFLDADDYFEGELVAGMARTAASTEADLVLGNMHIELPGPEGQQPQREQRFSYSGRVQPEEFLEGWMTGSYVNPSALFWKVEIVQAIGGWDEELWRAQDLDFVLRAMFEFPHIEKSEVGAAIYTRFNENSISLSLSERAQRSRFRASSRLLERSVSSGHERFTAVAPYFLRELYLIRVECLRDGYHELASEINGVLMSNGWRGHVGTPAHCLLSTLVGVERKIALSNMLHRIGRQLNR